MVVGLCHLEVLVACVLRNGKVFSYGRGVIFFHNRTAHATAHARRHFDKGVMNIAVFDILKRRDTVLDSVDSHILIAGSVEIHGFKHAARSREESCPALSLRIHLFFESNTLAAEPLGEFLVGEHGVHYAVVMRSLVLFSNARPYKHGFCTGVTFFEVLAVRLHRRKHVGEIRKFFWEILLYEQVDRMATRRDDYISLLFSQKSVVLVFDDGSAQSGFLNVGESEFFERSAHSVYAHALVVCDKGRSERNVDGICLQKHLDLFGFVDNFLCVLRTDHEAVTAQNTLVADDVRLITREANCFDGAMANTLIAVFAV